MAQWQQDAKGEGTELEPERAHCKEGLCVRGLNEEDTEGKGTVS